MSEIDDTEFLERIVKNNQDFVAGQIATMRKEMNNKISNLERKLKAMEEENHQKDATIARLTREIPLQVKTVIKEMMQAGIKTIEDNPETTRATEQIESVPQPSESSTQEPPQAKKRKEIEPFKSRRQKRISVVEKMQEAVMDPRDPEGFQAMWVSHEKGRGVFTTKSFHRGDFLLQYKGKFHSACPGDGSYIFEANSGGHSFWVDATEEDNSLGRLVNDDHINPSAVAKVCKVNGLSCICFYACRDISIGEEVTFNYSGSKNVDDYPWRRSV